jgi:predicted ATP-grasp superfamily ATP-dependent carboligase
MPRPVLVLNAVPHVVVAVARFQDLRDAFLLDPQFGVDNLLQEFCPGDGIGIEVLFHDNQPLTMFQHRRLKELPVSGGGSVTSVSEPLDPELTEQAVALLRKLNWEGVAMVEFKCDRAERRSVLMEVNGRYWGSLPLAIGAGIDFPFYEWQLAHGQQPVIPAAYSTGLRFRWLGRDIRRLGSLFEASAEGFSLPSKLGESIRFLKDFAGPTCPAVWSWSDPVPALLDCRRSIKYAVFAMLEEVFRKARLTIAEYRYHGRRYSSVALRLNLLYFLGLRARPFSARPERCPLRSVCLSWQHHSQRDGRGSSPQIPEIVTRPTGHRRSVGGAYRPTSGAG